MLKVNYQTELDTALLELEEHGRELQELITDFDDRLHNYIYIRKQEDHFKQLYERCKKIIIDQLQQENAADFRTRMNAFQNSQDMVELNNTAQPTLETLSNWRAELARKRKESMRDE